MTVAASDDWPSLALKGRDLFLIVILAVATMLVLDGFLPFGPPSPALVMIVLIVQAALLVGIIGLVAVRLRGVPWPDLGFRRMPPGWPARAVGVALLTLPLVWLINAVVQALSGQPFENPQIEMVAPGEFSWSAMIGMVAVTGVVVPIAEELAFRGVLYGWLRQRFGVTSSAIVSALIFSLVHGIPPIIPAIAAQGVVLALVYERSRSLWPAIIVHGIFNALTVIIVYAGLAAGLLPA